MNSFIWCVIGAVAGFVFSSLGATKATVIARLECILVGIFGAFIGAEFAPAAGTGQPPSMVMSIGLAIAGAVGMLMLLALMRRLVGPQKAHKVRRRRD